MTMIAVILVLVLLAGLTLFQALLVAGMPLGHFAWGGQHRVLPSHLRIGSVVSIVLYSLFAAIVLDRVGVISVLPVEDIRRWAIWVLAGYSLVGIGMNAISRSTPERYTMTPLAAALCLSFVVIAVS